MNSDDVNSGRDEKDLGVIGPAKLLESKFQDRPLVGRVAAAFPPLPKPSMAISTTPLLAVPRHAPAPVASRPALPVKCLSPAKLQARHAKGLRSSLRATVVAQNMLFVKDYATIASHLTNLLKRASFHWSANAAFTFPYLKSAMTSLLVLDCRILHHLLMSPRMLLWWLSTPFYRSMITHCPSTSRSWVPVLL
ncbi:hypothetical protein Salat_0671000 [Sesamum alatum]|uniref:Uncharacterized protein n=1 Tax=Sesamum alatum TaxID=300844 RepID=A0AAE2CUK1_9LAMI|nr:hypothetical protein Salat_0671000 [Sesamum alatum]